MKNISKENYLSTIYRYSDDESRIKTAIIAEKLNISNAAVTDMMKKLSLDGYVEYKRYKDIKLTTEGELYAKNMIRRHRIWELYLHRVLKMPWDKVHDEAEHLEHSSSDDLINRLEEILEYPEFDPHGDPIPDKNGTLPGKRNSVPLSLIRMGEKVEVVRVNDFDHKFLTYLSGIGINLNTELIVKDVLGFDNSMLIGINGTEINISNTIADNIFVIRKNN
ncbi:metal-dependent transcriptional regulator [Bacteroidota bacterium]